MSERLSDERVRWIANEQCWQRKPGEEVTEWIGPKMAEAAALAREVIDLREANGRMRGQITEASAIVRNGTEYERLHVAAILDAGLAPTPEEG